MTDSGYAMVLPFDSESHEFRRGVEVGMLFCQATHLTEPGDNETATVHVDNAEMVMRIAESFELEFTAAPLADDWLAVELRKP